MNKKTYIISLHVGSYHHVKRLFELTNKKVIKLTRIEFAGISHVGDLSHGEYRHIKPYELKWLKKLVSK